METRLGRRIKINLKIVSEVDKSLKQQFHLSGGNTFEAACNNISMTGVNIGMGMHVKYFLPKGLIFETQIDGAPFGLKEDMKLKGEVRYCNFIKTAAYKCGIKFLDIPQKYREAITQFINKSKTSP